MMNQFKSFQIRWHADGLFYCPSGYDPCKAQPSWWNDLAYPCLLAMPHGVSVVAIPMPRLKLLFDVPPHSPHARQSLWSLWLEGASVGRPIRSFSGLVAAGTPKLQPSFASSHVHPFATLAAPTRRPRGCSVLLRSTRLQPRS